MDFGQVLVYVKGNIRNSFLVLLQYWKLVPGLFPNSMK